jgi:hypothetical protein
VRQLVERHLLAVAPVSSIKLSDQEKLDTLQRLDRFRQWNALDEKRYCLVCGEIITGREIQVIRRMGGNGLLRIICPTEHCNAMPMEWVRPTEELLIRIAMVEAERHRLCMIVRAGRAVQSRQGKLEVLRSAERGLDRDSDNICGQNTETRGCKSTVRFRNIDGLAFTTGGIAKRQFR